jgi:hypothetical protein
MRYILLLAFFWGGCAQDETPKESTSANKDHNTSSRSKTEKQINLTILLDLSDRIDPHKFPDKPEHFQRDSTLISYFTDFFLSEMKSKGTYMAKGKMRVIFHPNPPDPGINQAAARLNIDLSALGSKNKKHIYETLKTTVAENVSHIYQTTIRQAVWPGSDIWRFFKNDVKEIAVDMDSSYRNLLVIFTDGYLYHADSKDRDANRYAYLLPELFDKYGLRNNNHWKEKIDQLDFGLICKRSDLEQLEILILEVAPSAKYKNDEDIIQQIIGRWLSEMKAAKWKIINSDLPEHTKQKINNFLLN